MRKFSGLLFLVYIGCYAAYAPLPKKYWGAERSCDLVAVMSQEGKQESFPLHVEVSPERVSIIALNPFGTRMLRVTSDGTSISVDQGMRSTVLSPELLFSAVEQGILLEDQPFQTDSKVSYEVQRETLLTSVHFKKSEMTVIFKEARQPYQTHVCPNRLASARP